jgi:hypothetical protein
MNFTPYVVTWAILAVIVLALLLWRNLMALHEDDNLHIEPGEERNQAGFYRKIHRIDRWGEILTGITVASGLVIAAAYIYQVWEIRSRLPG